ncbi:MAG: hypothetical protein DRJ64_04180 [Thermoprotei archaeon]|nr:MAG: hypothetical protein DRJ64_04180 [Thermoprotei archaeon]
MTSVSTLGRTYKKLYETLCGQHPHQRPWHFQWLAVAPLHRELRRIFRGLAGRVLDVGCGDKPYRHWFSKNVSQYIGLDVVDGPEVDMVVEPMGHWEISGQAFDVVIATQVLEHVENLNHTLSEITRVLRPGGTVILSFPFLYNEHGAPYDFRRFTRHSVENLLSGYDVQSVAIQGG